MNIPDIRPEEITKILEQMLAPVIDSIGEIERLKRREYLTPEEVEKVYGLKASTLANKRLYARGPEYSKDGVKILYRQQTIKRYLESLITRTVD